MRRVSAARTGPPIDPPDYGDPWEPVELHPCENCPTLTYAYLCDACRAEAVKAADPPKEPTT